MHVKLLKIVHFKGSALLCHTISFTEVNVFLCVKCLCICCDSTLKQKLSKNRRKTEKKYDTGPEMVKKTWNTHSKTCEQDTKILLKGICNWWFPKCMSVIALSFCVSVTHFFCPFMSKIKFSPFLCLIGKSALNASLQLAGQKAPFKYSSDLDSFKVNYRCQIVASNERNSIPVIGIITILFMDK